MKAIKSVLLFFLLVYPMNSFGESSGKHVQIGEIKSFAGDVLVRKAGKWEKLSKVPVPVYSSDKVVTKRGRTEVSFTDKGTMVLDLSTNVSFSGDRSLKVNVLLGEVWFNVNAFVGDVQIKTPSMSVSSSGASGKIKVNPSGDSKFGLSGGNADTAGSFDKLSYSEASKTPDTQAKELPKTDPSFENSPLQKAALAAAQAANEAALTAIKAVDQAKAAKTESKKAEDAGTDSAKKKAAVSSSNAALSQCDASLKNSKSYQSVIEESLLEAGLLKDSGSIGELEKSLDTAENVISKQEHLLSEIKSFVVKTQTASDSAAASMMSKAAQTMANSSSTNANVLQVLSVAATASTTGDAKLLAASSESAKIIQQLAITAEMAADNAANAAEKNNPGAVSQAAAAAETAARESGSLAKTPDIIIVETAPVGIKVEPSVTVGPAPSIVPVTLPDTKDLPSASPAI